MSEAAAARTSHTPATSSVIRLGPWLRGPLRQAARATSAGGSRSVRMACPLPNNDTGFVALTRAGA